MTQLETTARSLAAFRPERGWCISLFLDLDPGTVPTAHELGSHITSLVDEARREIAGLSERIDHDRAQGARADVERAAGFLENDLDRSNAKGFALFLSGLDGVQHGLRLSSPVEDAVRVGRAFVLAPLLESLEHDRELVLAAVGRDRGTLWRTDDGRTELLDDLSRDGQGQHDQGGWSQARYQRSRDREAVDHLHDVADAIGEEIPPGSETLLVVACVEEQRPIFEDLLAPHVRDALLGWASIEAHADDTALRPEAERLLEERLEVERRTLLGRIAEERPAGRAATSWEDAIPAAWDARIEAVVVDGRTREAWECPNCGRGSAVSGACELDGTPLEEALGGALELVVRGTLRSGGDVRLAHEDLDGTDGVAALLRYATES